LGVVRLKIVFPVGGLIDQWCEKFEFRQI